MKEFKKWLKNEFRKDWLLEPQDEYVAYNAWKAALECIRDKMLPNCHEPMDIYDFIEEELAC